MWILSVTQGNRISEHPRARRGRLYTWCAAIHRRQLASFFPQRTKVRDNRYVGAASRTLTLGDPIFRSLPSLPFNAPPASVPPFVPARFPRCLSLAPLSARLGSAAKLSSSSPPPRRLVAPYLTCTFSGISLYLRSGESAACEIPEVCGRRTLRYAAASRRATDGTRGEGAIRATDR